MSPATLALARAAIAPLYRISETTALEALAGRAELSAPEHQRVRAEGERLLGVLRAPGRAGWVDRFLQEYSLSSEEGAALLGLAEAYLRVPDSGETVVPDVILGETRFPNASLDDPVIARADGSPLYNLAVAVDDLDAGITHVVRGSDHVSNTPKQLLVFEALGQPAPVYAHLPLLLGPDGKKLSKRHGAASVQELGADGYLPEAVDNYIALLGAGFAADEEYFTLDELAARFRLDRVSKNPAVFDERKLRHMNGRYLRELGIEELTRRLEGFTGRSGLRGAVEISAEKIQTLADFWPLAGFLLDGPVDDPAAFERIIGSDGGAEILRSARDALSAAAPFTEETVEAALRGVVEQSGLKPGKVFQPVRVAISGTTASPGIFESVALLGREEVLARVDRALNRAGGDHH